MGATFMPDKITKHKVVIRRSTKGSLIMYVIGGERTFNQAAATFYKRDKYGD